MARLAQVAPTTVSLILNGRAEELKIAPDTRRRVEEAARRLRYVPNAAARALQRRHSQIVGLLWDRPADGPHAPIYADVVTSTIDCAHGLGYFVLVLPSVSDRAQGRLQAAWDADLAGLLCRVGERSKALGEEISRRGVPVVWLEPQVDRPQSLAPRTIGIDAASGLDDLGRHLREGGRESLAVIMGPGDIAPRGPRYRNVLKWFQGRSRSVQVTAWTSEAGQQGMEELLATGAPPDAVYAGNDLLAVGAQRTCQRRGMRVPDDVAIAGFGDFHVGLDVYPTLTTVTWPLDEMAAAAVELLITLVDAKDTPAPARLLGTALIARESTQRGLGLSRP